MSDSSEDEDLSRFKEVVDTSFTKVISDSSKKLVKDERKPKSERYLEESSHYNDVKVPQKMQDQIGQKISNILCKNIEFVKVEPTKIKSKIKGGVRLFNSSEGFMSCEDVKDVSTELHNQESKRIERKRRQIDNEDLNENDKINAVAVSGDQIMSKEETKMWKSRRKEKLFKYKKQGKSKVLISMEL